MTTTQLLHQLCSRHAIVIIGGGPNTGKTWLANNEARGCPVIHTDDWKDYSWNDVPELAAAEAAKHTRCVIEGVRAPAVIRHGIKAGAILWLSTPMVPLSAKDKAMAKARLAALAKMQREGWLEGVEVEFAE